MNPYNFGQSQPTQQQSQPPSFQFGGPQHFQQPQPQPQFQLQPQQTQQPNFNGGGGGGLLNVWVEEAQILQQPQQQFQQPPHQVVNSFQFQPQQHEFQQPRRILRAKRNGNSQPPQHQVVNSFQLQPPKKPPPQNHEKTTWWDWAGDPGDWYSGGHDSNTIRGYIKQDGGLHVECDNCVYCTPHKFVCQGCNQQGVLRKNWCK